MVPRNLHTTPFQFKNSAGAASARSSQNGFEQKFVSLTEFKMLEEGPGGFDGYVSIFGNLDDGGDILLEGSYDQKVLDLFISEGFTAHSHDWDLKTGAIGYPMTAVADSVGLKVTHKFHGTPDAQELRQKISERIADKKVVGLSIGYKAGEPIYVSPSQYASELPKYLKKEFLAEGLEKAKNFARVRVLPKVVGLAESSIVTRAMNRVAQADNVKGAGDNDEGQLSLLDAERTSSGQEGKGTPPAPPAEPTPAAETQAKAGARNSTEDKKRLQRIHDDITYLEDKVCPANAEKSADASSSATKTQSLRQFCLKMAEYVKTIAGLEKKGLFEEALAELTKPSLYQIYWALLNTVDQLDELQEAVEGTDVVIDIPALVDEALAAFAITMREAILARLDQPEVVERYIYYGAPPADFKFKALLKGVETATFDQHSLAVVTAVEEFGKVSTTIGEAIAVFTDRANEKQEFRIGADKRTISEETRTRKAAVDAGLVEARDRIVLAVEKSDSLSLLTPEDLTGQFNRLKLNSERLRTNAASAATAQAAATE